MLSLLRTVVLSSLAFCLGTQASAQCLDWSPIFSVPGQGIGTGEVIASAEYDDGSGPALYVLGTFTTVGSQPAQGFASWNGSAWTVLTGLGANANVRSATVYDDGGGAVLVVGGSQLSIGGGPFQRLVKWTTATGWQAFADQPDSDVSMVGAHDWGLGQRLVIGGVFQNVGSVPAVRVAQFDGASWSAMGAGLNTESACSIVYDPGTGPLLVLGGFFGFSGATLVGHMAVWDGTNWTAPAGGLVTGAAGVDAFEVFDDGSGSKLYVGGNFSFVNGLDRPHIARWTGTIWENVPDLQERVRDFAVYDVGAGPQLYALHERPYPGMEPNGRVHRFAGGIWNQLGLGVSPGGRQLRTFSSPAGTFLHVLGAITSAGGLPSRGIARWGEPCSLPTIVEQPMPVTAVFPTAMHLQVTAIGTGPLTYQWRKDGVNVVDAPGLRMGSTTNHLQILAWSFADHGDYDCFVQGALGTVYSNTAAVTVPAGGSSGVPIVLDLVLRTEDPLPGLPGALNPFGGPQMASDGTLAVSAEIGVVGCVLLRPPAGTTTAIARSSNPAAGLPGLTYATSGFPHRVAVADNGTCAFTGKVAGPGVTATNDDAVWWHDGTTTHLVARAGDALPGGSAGQILRFDTNETGSLACTSDGRVRLPVLVYTGNTYNWLGIVAWDLQNGLAVVAHTGQPAPGTGQNWTNIELLSAQRSGPMSFLGIYSGGFGIWGGDLGSITNLFIAGDPVPSAIAGETISSVVPTFPIGDDAGGSFAQVLTTANGGAFTSEVVLRHHQGTTTVRARRGDPAAGAPGTSVYTTPQASGASTSGAALFSAAMDLIPPGGPSQGLWLSPPTGSALPVIFNRPLPPEAPPSFLFGGISSVAMNNRDQVVVQVILEFGQQYQAVYGWTAAAGLFPIAVPGTQIEVVPGVYKTVRTAFLAGPPGTSGAPRPDLRTLNDQGDLGLMVRFTDLTTALFVAHFVEIQGLYHATGSNYCSGDGSATACPCGVAAGGNGCPNSIFPDGANLNGTGVASLAEDTVTLHVTSIPNSTCLIFQGTTQVAGGAGAVFGDGLRCAGGAIVRIGTRAASSNAVDLGADVPGDPLVHVRGQVTTAGSRTYQAWYRNAAAYCTPATFNLTNGYAIEWQL